MAEFDPDAFLARDEKREKKSTGFDPDAFLKKTQPESALQTFGRSAASMADSALNAVTGTLDYGAYALARAAGRSPEQATAETTSPKDVIGRMAGVTGTPGYENAPLRTVGNVVGQTIGENVVAPIASATGLPEADVGNMVNSAMMGIAPAVPKVAGAVKPVVKGAYDVGAGFGGTITGRTAAPGAQPKPWQQPSARQPVGDTYIPAPVLEQYRAGAITAEQAQAAARPTSELSGLAATGGNVPYAGQGMRAFGEQLGETYRNPLNVLTDVGLDVVTGGPLPTIGRMGYKGYQAYNANKLSNLGFTPLAPDEFSALRPGGPVAPGGGGAGAIRQQAAAKINTQALPPEVIAAQQAAADAKVAAAEAAARERAVVQPVDPAYIAEQQAQAAAQAAAEQQAKAIAKAKAEQMVADMMAKKTAEREAIVSGEVSGPVAPTRDIIPMESPESRAIARAEAKAETPLTTREKLDKTVQTAYRPVAGQGNVLDKTLINQTLVGEGLPAVDWSKLGIDYQSMSVKDARKTIQKFIEKETGVSGAGTRGPTQKTQMKEANERLAYEQSQRSPEEVAKELADMQAAIERRKRVLGDKYRAPGGDRFSMMTAEPEKKSSIPRPNFPEGSAGNPFTSMDDAKMQHMQDILTGSSENNPPGKFTYYIKDKDTRDVIVFNKNKSGTEYSVNKRDGSYDAYNYMPESGFSDGPEWIKHVVDKDGVQKTTRYTSKPDWWPTLLE